MEAALEKEGRLLHNRTFMLMLVAGIFAIMGYSTFLTTVSWYAVSEVGSATAIALVLISATVPRLLMMVFGGVVADKFKKTTIMFYSNLMQGCMLLILYMLIANGELTLSILLMLATVFGMLDAFFGPASTSLIPKVVPKAKLQRANAMFQGVDQLAFIIGPIIAGMMMEAYSVPLSFFVAMVLVFFSAIFVFPPFIKEADVEKTTKQTPIQDFKEGVQYIRKSTYLIIGILVLITLNFFVFGALHIAIPLLVETLGGSPIHLSFMESSLGVGMLLGTILLSVFTLRNNKASVSVFALLSTILLFIGFSRIDSLLWLVVLIFFIGFSIVFVFVPFFTIAQENTEGHVMGRVMSIIFLAMNGFDPLSYAIIAGLTAVGLSVQSVLLGLGIAGLLAWLVIFTRSKAYRAMA
ncbi:MFS transporter [Bacillaceae bacterium SIJ1]|uniref:MFS transporter n=1 Tax=Litoribacterium kuwaitense TaxID=1398745 RepID=UPI0013EB30EE|nr:MFS transporter [Litoribacterium kuwaitense]NGP44663.1 MFS transporter [Litoribacterium kuwaitense]